MRYLFVLTIFLISCENQIPVEPTEAAAEKETIKIEAQATEEEVFHSFLTKFSTDTIYQRERINFPLKYDVVVNDQLLLMEITSPDWIPVNLEAESDLEPMERIITIENDSAKVEFIGMVTPTFNGYLFVKDSVSWKLQMFSDYSK